MLGAAVLALIVVSAVVFKPGQRSAPEPIAFSQFLQDVAGGRIFSVIAEGDDLTFSRTDGSQGATLAPTGYLAANPTFVGDLSRHNVHLEVIRHDPSKASSYGAFAIGMVFFGFVGLALYRLVTGRVP